MPMSPYCRSINFLTNIADISMQYLLSDVQSSEVKTKERRYDANVI